MGLTRQTWFDAHPVKAKFLVFVLCLVVVEISLRVFVWLDWLPYTRYPTSAELQFWTKSEPVVGIWHQPDSAFDDDRDCFDARYESNSFGARDRERSLRLPGEERVIVLGDSLIEGLGIAYGDRLTEILESQTGIEHMNVASSDWGTIQQWLFYENYASAYDHSGVFLFIFPANDFREIDPEKNSSTKYKPFLRPAGRDMEVFYPVAFEDRDAGGRSAGSVIKNVIDNTLYVANLLRYAWRMTKRQARRQQDLPYYDDFSEAELKVFLYALDRLAQATGGRPLYLITIPAFEDISYAQNTQRGFRLIDELTRFAQQYGHVEVIDLLPYFMRYMDERDLPYEALTLGCDWHWGVSGNRIAAQALIDHIYGE